MNYSHEALAALAAVAIFIYALNALSRELNLIARDHVRSWLNRVTSSLLAGYGLGATATAILQSSSAVTSLAVSLVDAKAISFAGSLPILLGANLGTTLTVWLATVNVSSIGAALIVIGTAHLFLHGRLAGMMYCVFCLGLVLFSLTLLSESLRPLKGSQFIIGILEASQTPLVGILAGAAATAVLQSSSATLALAVALAQQGLVSPAAVFPLVIGANVGTTSTALIASIGMGAVARKAALANLLFNAAAAVVALPFLPLLNNWLIVQASDLSTSVAVAHVCFNAVVAAVGFPMIRPLLRALHEQTSER